MCNVLSWPGQAISPLILYALCDVNVFVFVFMHAHKHLVEHTYNVILLSTLVGIGVVLFLFGICTHQIITKFTFTFMLMLIAVAASAVAAAAVVVAMAAASHRIHFYSSCTMFEFSVE